MTDDYWVCSMAIALTFFKSTLPEPSRGRASTRKRFSRFGIHSLGNDRAVESLPEFVSCNAVLAVKGDELFSSLFIGNGCYDGSGRAQDIHR